MEKRGQAEVLEITLLFEFVAGVLIAGILIYAVITINETSNISEEYLRKDYNIIKNMMEGKPGEYSVKYPIGVFEVKDNEFKKPDDLRITGDNEALIRKEKGKVGLTKEK